MYRKIMVPLDGSMLSEKALPYAIRVANRYEAQLVLFRVIEPPSLLTNPEDEARYAKEVEIYLDDVKRVITQTKANPSITPERVQVVVAYNNKPVEEIVAYLPVHNVDLLIMTTHGRSGFSRLVMGSVAGRVLHQSNIPVMLIRPFGQKYDQLLEETLTGIGEPYGHRFETDGGNVLLTLDGTDMAVAALEPAIELAQKLKATLHLLRVNYPITPVVYGDMVGLGYSRAEVERTEDEHKQEAREYLAAIAQKCAAKGVPTVQTVEAGAPEELIVAYAAEIEAQAIVMATHAPGEFSYFFLGSVAEEVMRRSHLPVLLIPVHKPVKVAAEEAPPLEQLQGIEHLV